MADDKRVYHSQTLMQPALKLEPYADAKLADQRPRLHRKERIPVIFTRDLLQRLIERIKEL